MATVTATESGPAFSGGSGPAVRSQSLLVPGSFTDEDPYQGLESTLWLFEYGERLGLDGAWIRQQHLVPNVSSAAVFLAAASQRTRRIELGTAVIPIGYESPFRLAEDLSMLDVLSRGRLQAGFSAGVPANSELLAGLLYDGDWRGYDFSHARIARLAANLRGPGTGHR
jgi:alkanesulfonate monooxygenase SsuD/methylene tetrahydromethanopterin reductase-like flavin-dependent oxidoreductase (luciferase family)